MSKKNKVAKARARWGQQRKCDYASPRSSSPQGALPATASVPTVPADGECVRRGLANLGNTCFLNSIVQCLNVSVPFSDGLMSLLPEGLGGLSGSLCGVFRGIRGMDVKGGGKGAFSPQQLHEELVSKFPCYGGTAQQDAHEFLRTLLGSVSDESTAVERNTGDRDGAGQRPPSKVGVSCGRCVTQSFRGHICAATLCWSCRRLSLKLDPFLDLSLDLPSLKGQAVGAMGVTAAAASGLPGAPEEDPDPGAAASAEEGAGAGWRGWRKKGEGRAEVAEPWAPEPRASKVQQPRGAWAQRTALEEHRSGSRAYAARVVARAVERQRPEQLRKASKERLRQEFCGAAARCHEGLPPNLQVLFGPEAPLETNKNLRLEDCLRRFSVVEALEDDLKPVYQCQCVKGQPKGTRTFASRRLWLWRQDLPPLLTLQLKRFCGHLQRFEKSSASISLPAVIDVGDYVLQAQELGSVKSLIADGVDIAEQLESAAGVGSGQTPFLYELYGVCVHQGSTMQSGHYVAYVNSGPSLECEKWFGISDARVWSCSRADVLKAEAYVAFYRRESGAAAAAECALHGQLYDSAGPAATDGPPQDSVGPAAAAAGA